MATATIALKFSDFDEVNELLAAFRAEHHALHAYLFGLLQDQTHRPPTVEEYQDLVGSHDAVAALLSGLRSEE